MRAAGELSQRRRTKALKRAIERLPADSRRAMLAGLAEGPIIAGAYSAGPAICPALAAYRRGARTGYSEFAEAWDRFARGRGVRRARKDDLATLIEMLRAGLPSEVEHAVAHPENGRGNGRASASAVPPSGTNGGPPARDNRNGSMRSNGARSTGEAPLPSEDLAR
jgi:hypothetical protein